MKLVGMFVIAVAVTGCKDKDKTTGPAPSTGTAAASGTGAASGTAGSGTGTGTSAAETFELGNVMPDQWFAEGAGCPRVAVRIGRCSREQAFRDGLLGDLEGDERKAQETAADHLAGWGDDAVDSCKRLPKVAYKDAGFLGERWDALDGIEDCGQLGAVIREAGGLPRS